MSLPVKDVYRFDEFVLDPPKRTFARHGKPVSVSPKAFEVLTYLVSHSGQVVTKDELLKAVWPDSFVEEGNLAQHISWLRKALGDRANDIVTVPGRGYQFTALVRKEAPAELVPETRLGDTLVHGVRERTHVVIEESSPLPLAEKTARASTRAWPYTLVAVGLAALATWTVWKWLRPAPPAEFQKIVVADFINATGDPAFDRTLKRALEIDLAQSPFLDVMSEGEAVSTLQLMSRKGDVAVAANVAMELCVRSNRQVFLTGSITSVGRAYLLMLGATDCNSGKELVSAKTQVGAKEEVLGALDVVADRIRRGLGESAKFLERYQVPISKATTPSLEALKAFSLGEARHSLGEFLAAVPFYQRAIELDPNFALAYARLGVDQGAQDEELSEENLKKAFELRDRASERERLYITAHYYGSTGQLEEQTRTWELYKQTYPRDPIPYTNLAALYSGLGQYDKELENSLEAVPLAPDNAIGYLNAAHAYMCLNLLEEAKAILDSALQRKVGGHFIHLDLSSIAIAQGDIAAQEREDASIKGNAEGELDLVSRDAGLAASRGQLRKARELFMRERQMAQRLNLKESAAGAIADEAGIEADFGYRTEAAKSATAALAISRGVVDSAARTLALAGEANKAETLIAEMAKRRPKGVWVQSVFVPEVKAINEINRGNPAKAIELLQAAIPYDGGTYFAIRYTRGNAYLRARNGDEAAQEFQKVLALRNAYPESPLMSLAQLGLARACALPGDKPKSRIAYQDFFALWKEADPDIPILKEAKAEYAKLK